MRVATAVLERRLSMTQRAFPISLGILLNAGLISGCQYTALPDSGANTASGTATPASSHLAGTANLKGKIEANQFSEPMRYTSVEGDTWEGIAAEFGLKTETLKEFNKTVSLQAGSILDVRGSNTPQGGAHGSTKVNPDGTLTYSVVEGDTQGGLISRFGVPGYALRGANPEFEGPGGELKLFPGRSLTIPAT
jgi:hypothetical protein